MAVSGKASLDPEALYASPNAIASYYSRFRVAERLLLTGHSHQAWPDVGFAAQQQAWLDAAEYVDEKWVRAAKRADEVREGWRRLLGDRDGDIALGVNTHELVTRWLSALPLRTRSRLVTTDAEFHTIRRQLERLGEEGLEIVRVPGHPVETVAERLAAVVDDRTAAVLLSSVYYETAEIVPNLERVAACCVRVGAALLVDAYHHLNVVPFDIGALGLQEAFVTGGGYKYCQLGEGNGFLRIPPGCRLRPVLTGWFTEFERLEQSGRETGVRYGAGAARFAGATYDPTSHYRAASVFRFHEGMGLTPALLRKVSQHQVGVLESAVRGLNIDPAVAHVVPVPAESRGGFLSVRCRRAGAVCQAMRARGVRTDWRHDLLRLGPAPYLSDDQLKDAVSRLGEAVKEAG